MLLRGYLVRRRWGLLLAVMVVLVDALSKSIVLAEQLNLPVSVVDGWLAIVLAWNRGMSFSLLSDPSLWWGPWLLGAIAVLAIAAFTHWLGERTGWHQVGLGLIIGGAVGNLLDRVQHGAVVDFVLFYRGAWAFPAFNVADSAITLGVIVLLWMALWPGAVLGARR